MYSLHLEREVSTSHQLKKHDGKCKNLHGHNFKFSVDISATHLISGGSSDGMVVDFGTIKRILDTVDHTHINSVAPTEEMREQPTAERLAKFFAEKIYKESHNPSILAVSVRVEEATGQSVSYRFNAQDPTHLASIYNK